MALIGLLGTGEAKAGQGAAEGGGEGLCLKHSAGIRQRGRDGSFPA